MTLYTNRNTSVKPKRITIMNSKGGCGKSTLATNLASIFSTNQLSTTLIDHDPQGSSIRWLNLRPKHYPGIYGIRAVQMRTGTSKDWQLRVPAATERLIVDTPAGVRGEDLSAFANNSDFILIPVVPSDSDIHASTQLISELLLNVKVRSLGVKVGVVANRVKKNTRILNHLYRFLEHVKFPCISVLRDTQNYVNAARAGMGIHEIAPASLVQNDVQQWDNILAFLESGNSLTCHKKSRAQVIDIKTKRMLIDTPA